MPADLQQFAGVHPAPNGMVTTVEAVVFKADGRQIDYGVIATSDAERVPLSPRLEEE